MIDFALLFVLGAFVGYKVASALHTRMISFILKELNVTDKDLRNLAKKAGMDLPEESTADSDMDEYEIVVEKHGDELYAFKVDGEFLGQGRDRDTLVARIAERFKNVRFTVAEGKEYLTNEQG